MFQIYNYSFVSHQLEKNTTNFFLPTQKRKKIECSLAFSLQDQMRALDMIQSDAELMSLRAIQAPLVDVEIRGVPALRFMGEMVWK